jgi:excisionase family DNA binding protein
MKNMYLTTPQVAKLFNVDNSTIRRWSIIGKIECESTHGGHRKFLFKNIVQFLKNNPKKYQLDFSSILSASSNFNPNDYAKLIKNYALKRDINQIDLLIMKFYLEGIKIPKIFDNYIDISLDEIQKLLDEKKISIAEEHIARKTISKSLDNFRSSISTNLNKNNSVLCINLENDIPDLAIDMIQIILEEQGCNVHNSGSNTSILNLQLLLEKYEFNSMYIYMCNRQCCSATVKNNFGNTILDLEKINKLCNRYNIDLFIGGPGTQLINSKITFQYNEFNKFSDLAI